MGKLKARTKLSILLVIPSILFSVATLFLAKGYLFDFFRETQQDSLKRVSAQIVHSLKGSIDQVNMLALDIEKRIQQDNSPENIRAVIDIITGNRSDFIRGITYLDETGTLMGSPDIYWEFFGEAEKKVIEKSVHKNEVGVYWSPHFYSLINRGNSSNPASIATKAIYNGKRYMGTLAIVVDLDKFISNTVITGGNYEIRTLLYDADGSLADRLDYQHFDENNQPLMQSEPELQTYASAQDWLAGRRMYYSVSEMAYHPGWKILVIGDVQKLESKFAPFSNNFAIVILFGVAGLFCIYFLVMWWFTKPLIHLIKGIRRVGTGDFEYRLDLKRKDEFGAVADELNRMSELIKNLILELNASNEKKRDYDFQVLLSQINPHFLYNTLNSIDMMMDTSSRKEVHRAMDLLVSLLKYGLDKNAPLRTLQEEFSYIETYVEILKIRYGCRFTCSLELPAGLRDVPVLKLLLQPLVENAVFHGLHPLKDRQGLLTLCVWKEDEVLLAEVSDNGVGMEEETVRNLLRTDQNGRTSIGIRNVHERIQLYYGETSGLEIVSRKGRGTTVIARIHPRWGKSLPEAVPQASTGRSQNDG